MRHLVRARDLKGERGVGALYMSHETLAILPRRWSLLALFRSADNEDPPCGVAQGGSKAGQLERSPVGVQSQQRYHGQRDQPQPEAARYKFFWPDPAVLPSFSHPSALLWIKE